MLKRQTLQKFGLFGIVGLVVLFLSGCGNDHHHYPVTGPGLVGIEDSPRVAITAPELYIKYTRPGIIEPFEAWILSDQSSDGDIEYDPFFNSYVITEGPATLLFGFDSARSTEPEFRAFLDFPLDGSTGEPDIPLDAIIVSATLTVFIDFVDFAATVPVVLDRVEYLVESGLTFGDFDSPPPG